MTRVPFPPLIYVAGPFSAPTREGVEEHIARAVAVGIEVARLGAMPVIPHANTAHPSFESVQPYTFWLAGTLHLLHKCDGMILVPGWEHSRGTRGEIESAEKHGIPLFYSVTALALYLKGLNRG